MVSNNRIAASVVAAVIFGTAVSTAPAQAPAVPKYRSALDGYQPFREEKAADWRGVNHTAGLLGGHGAHLREASDVVTATGTVLELNRAAAWVRIDGDGVKALGWPAGIAFWPLKSAALADQVKPGDRVVFRLEKAEDVYRIAAFDRDATPAPKRNAPANPHAGHHRGEHK